MASDFDKKQLPLKILANSFFGAYGAPYIFNWGDTDCAEETTCRGRQSLRLMVKHFFETHGFRPLVGDTDGFNFAIPEHIDTISYIAKGNHWKTSKYENGTELIGLEAVLADFNETYMEGRMGLDIDDICESTINFARKNYGNLIDGKVKLVGNSVKSKAMPVYIEEFLAKGIKLLLDGQGYEFVEWYYQYVDKIYNYQIPVAKIASKSKVKMTPENYKNVYCKQKNKAGNSKARQAHMELILKHGLKVNLGDVIYYVNNGSAKSHSDIKGIKDKVTKQVTEIQFNCKMIPQDQLDKNPDYTTDEYNVAKYLDAFNKRIKPLLVCFHPDIRSEISIDVKKDKKTKLLKLEDRKVFTRKQCKLTAGYPTEPTDQDTYEALMTMSDEEIRFWDSVDKLPNFMEQDEWDEIRVDWKERMRVERINGIQIEKDLIKYICSRLEVSDYIKIKEDNELPKELLNFTKIDKDEKDNFFFHSIKWDVNLAKFETLFDYEEEAIQRAYYYNSIGDDVEEDRYEMWLEYKNTLEESGSEFGVPPEEAKHYETDDEKRGMMKDFLNLNYWEQGYDKQWIRKDWDYNQTGSFSLEDAYKIELKYQKDLETAKNQKPEDLIMNLNQGKDEATDNFEF
jgi:hypothetical protein